MSTTHTFIGESRVYKFLHRRLLERIANNEKTAATHPDSTVRSMATARVDAYRVALMDLESMSGELTPKWTLQTLVEGGTES